MESSSTTKSTNYRGDFGLYCLVLEQFSQKVDPWATRETHRVKSEACSTWNLSRWDLPVKAIGFFTRGEYNDITVCRLDSLLESRQ